MSIKYQMLKTCRTKWISNFNSLGRNESHGVQRSFVLSNLVVAAVIVALLVVGCGGGGSSSSGSSTTTASGVVADGYLAGARVFLDLNDNRIWDEGEPYAISGSDGSYSISDIDQEDYNSYPVVAEITLTTIDQDTGKPVSHPYTLVAPAAHPDFISPLTTMIQVTYERNPDITLNEAHAAVKEMLSMGDNEDVDLFSNYIEEKSDADSLSPDYAKLHNIAQLCARIMGANTSAVESAAEDEGVLLEEAKDEILRIVVKVVMDSMDLITEVATEETDFDADQGVQALAIQVDTSNISADIESEATAKLYQVPSLSWAGIFRNHVSGGSQDVLCMALEQELDLTGYEFTVEGPNGAEYIFEQADLYYDASAPIAWCKGVGSVPEGEYTFYITVPDKEKLAVAKDTHEHTVIPALSLASAEVVNIDGADSRIYHDLLDGTYYYRMAILDKATQNIVYNTKRRDRNIQYFPSKYATADYQYRLEVWDRPLFKDATARFKTEWANLDAAGASRQTYIDFFRGYHRNRGDDDNPSIRLVVQIGITNPTDITKLTVTGPAGSGITYTFDLTAQPNDNIYDDASDPRTHFFRGSGITEEGRAYADYFLQLRPNPTPLPTGVYTWTVDTASGGASDIVRSVTVYDRKALPAVDSDTVTVTEDLDGDVTFEWDAVASPDPETNIFYRVVIVRDEDWDNQYYSLRIPGTSWKGSRADIEDVIGGTLDSSDGGRVQYSIHVMDAQYVTAVKNRTDFVPVDLLTTNLR